jgi:hypothetical protein
MPTCSECGCHWFNPVIHKCPVCGALTVDGLAGALSEAIRNVPAFLDDLPALGERLFSDNPVVRKAALNVLAKAQTRSAFELLLSAARKTRAEARYDTLCMLYYYPQYVPDLVPFLLDVAAEPDDGSHCKSMAVTVMGNLGQPAIQYLIEHQTDISDQDLFWEAVVSAADKLDDAHTGPIAHFITRELESGRVAADCMQTLLRIREKAWFPTDRLVECTVGLLASQSPSTRNAAANVLFHCASVSEQAKQHLTKLQRDEVLGIRFRALQVASDGGEIPEAILWGARLEAIVEWQADERFWSKEQCIREIERVTQRSFAEPKECLNWIRRNCFAA